MKKLFAILFALFIGVVVFADEATLFDCTAKADVLNTSYDWVANAKAVGVSGYYIPGQNLYNPIVDEKYGLAIRTDAAPDADSNYAISFITPAFNEPNSGAGYIRNAAAIKSMDITLTLNRGEDEVTIYWMQNGTEHHRKFIPTRDSGTTIESMIEFTCHLDFEEYVDDVRNRDIRQVPVAGTKLTNIYLTKIQVTTHKQNNWIYSPTSIVGIKKISVVYDKAITDEAYDRGQEADKTFGINPNADLENITRKQIENDIRMTDYNKSLMATDESKPADTTDAK